MPQRPRQRPRNRRPPEPREIASGTYLLDVGSGLMRSNVYLVRSGSSWVLIDTGAAGCESPILEAARSLFGSDGGPASILLTHSHPDHAGCVRSLARAWECPVYVHPGEMPMVSGDLTLLRPFASPLDRWVVFPLLRVMGQKRTQAIVMKDRLADLVSPLHPDSSPPGLPDWGVVPTPGHTPGHVAFFRREDRVLVAGDALLSIDLNSPFGFLLKRQRLSGPPWYTSSNWREVKASVARLADLEPDTLAAGHGLPITGPDTAALVRRFSARFSGSSTGGAGGVRAGRA